MEQIDGNGDPVEEWVLRNAFVSKVTYGDLDYTSDDMSEITLEITYDWAELQLSHTPANGYSITSLLMVYKKKIKTQ